MRQALKQIFPRIFDTPSIIFATVCIRIGVLALFYLFCTFMTSLLIADIKLKLAVIYNQSPTLDY